MILLTSNSQCYKHQYLSVVILSSKHKNSVQKWLSGHTETHAHLDMVLNMLHKTLPSFTEWHFTVTHNEFVIHSTSPIVPLLTYMKFSNIHEGPEVHSNFNYLQTSWS
jgi:hypothetical protein